MIIVADRLIAEDAALPNTGVGLDIESAYGIKILDYIREIAEIQNTSEYMKHEKAIKQYGLFHVF